MCMCMCIYIYIYICLRILACLYACLYVNMYACMSVCTYIYACKGAGMYAYAYIHMHRTPYVATLILNLFTKVASSRVEAEGPKKPDPIISLCAR